MTSQFQSFFLDFNPPSKPHRASADEKPTWGQVDDLDDLDENILELQIQLFIYSMVWN